MKKFYGKSANAVQKLSTVEMIVLQVPAVLEEVTGVMGVTLLVPNGFCSHRMDSLVNYLTREEGISTRKALCKWHAYLPRHTCNQDIPGQTKK
ncbi:MAG: hypothetical protein VR68_01025 [Peptococcaceae bacterium BRH_c4a]|nr:MAG: hypothetical protein VR68_01025 [Peptococcaceae bacterium BRH_c4a]